MTLKGTHLCLLKSWRAIGSIPFHNKYLSKPFDKPEKLRNCQFLERGDDGTE